MSHQLTKERADVSRSYRKPYTASTGLPHSHNDKKKASRGVRSRQNAWLRSGLPDLLYRLGTIKLVQKRPGIPAA